MAGALAEESGLDAADLLLVMVVRSLAGRGRLCLERVTAEDRWNFLRCGGDCTE